VNPTLLRRAMGHEDPGRSQTSTMRGDRKGHLIQPECELGAQWVVDQPLPYTGHPTTASGVPRTQGPHPGDTAVGGGKTSEAAEIIDQVGTVTVTRPHLKFIKRVGPDANFSEHRLL
jgi:hypothetical protein